MTKAQRKARAKRAGTVRRKANAVKMFMRKMNPGKKTPVAVRVKRLKGGGFSVTPVKLNSAARRQKKAFMKTIGRRSIRKRGPAGPYYGAKYGGLVRSSSDFPGRRSRSRGTHGQGRK